MRSLFQVARPATTKFLQPIVVLVRGMMSAPLFANRSCHLPTKDETGVHSTHLPSMMAPDHGGT